jgi:hypothetical protein
MRSTQVLAILSLLFVVSACIKKTEPASLVDQNPPAPGFDWENSHPAAIQLADSVMKALGGRQNWDNTRFISWNFFERRNLVWDKHTGRVRIESLPDSTIYLVNVNTGEGRVRIKGREITHADSLARLLDKAKSIWINDSYWLVMPFKLKDDGVTLSYLGEDTIAGGIRCNIIELTFNNVGDTPENKYRVFIDAHDKRVKQWSYFANALQDSASATWPWDNYKKYGNILLSADRSDGKGPKRVRVDDVLPDAVFDSF